MKRFLFTLALGLTLAGAAQAAGWNADVSAPLTFTKGATTDSTTISLEWSLGATGTGDTTRTFNLNRYTLIDWCNATSVPVLRLHLRVSGADNAANSASGDTMEVTPQFSYDGSIWTSNTAVLAIGASPTLNKVFDAEVEASAPGLGAPFWRFIVTHFDGSAQTTRQVSCRAVVYVQR